MSSRRKISSFATTIIALSVLYATAPVFAVVPTYVQGSTAVDVSWPHGNCHAATKFLRPSAIIGANGGLDFRPNTCLRAEAARFSNVSLYANSGYPGRDYGLRFASTPKHCSRQDNVCLAYNWGFNAGVYAVTYAARQGVHANQWWVDVETDNSWTTNPLYNRASIAGEVAGITHATLFAAVGIYSYPGQWDLITNNWRNGLPNWVATGSASRQIATAECRGDNFTGGGTWLTQYVRTLDEDYVCQTH
ncbi:MAG TPA: hypothetical protein VGS08_00535 [Candidatus Saccharimonadales bacterium]|nr:hypothetical protein [Candidatus Saccharimonadales bacterium]